MKKTIVSLDNFNDTYFYQYSDDYNKQLKSITLPNGATQTMSYDQFGRLKTLNVNSMGTNFNYLKKGDRCSNLVNSVTYTQNNICEDVIKYVYDQKGNITNIFTYSSMTKVAIF